MREMDIETPSLAPLRGAGLDAPAPVQAKESGLAKRRTARPKEATPDAAATPDKAVRPASGTLTVGVCCITRERPNMLSDLLTSLGQLELPDDIVPFFVVVENDPEPRCRKQVEEASELLGDRQIHYANEPRLGIPIARNRAVDMALEHGADLIAFIDDDEIAKADWLAELVARYRETGASLIGGPVQARLDGPKPSTFLAHLVRSGLVARYKRIARKCEWRSRTGRVDRITIITNNWLAESALFTEHGLAFDEDLRFSGGSDTRFFRDVRRTRKLPTAWAEKALVLETLPDERLTYRYQFRRAMEQSKTSIRSKVQRRGRGTELASAPFSLAARMVMMSLLLLTVPFRPADSVLRFVRSSGWIAGRVTGLAGSSSALYRTTTGA